MDDLVHDLLFEFRRHKQMADRAMAALNDPQFFQRPGTVVNPVALIVKHLAGNLVSRWTEFLTTDGEKPSRDRDGEFLLAEEDTRASLLAAWEHGWAVLFAAVDGLHDTDLGRTVTIRGEGLTVRQALLRGMDHVAYHTGQIAYLSRWFQPDSLWLTIAPGQSRGVKGGYLNRQDDEPGRTREYSPRRSEWLGLRAMPDP
jgi:uncharacterized damage-inducible protein DinB